VDAASCHRLKGDQTMNEYIVIVQEGTDEMGRWSFHCDADDADHAQKQALDHDDVISCIAVYERIK